MELRLASVWTHNKRKMYRRKFENNAVHSLRRSNRSTVKATVNEGVQLAPFLYSDEIRLFTEGPIQVCSYHYSLRKASKKSYICEIFFYPKVVIKKHISVVIHFPAKNNPKPFTIYKDMMYLVPRCLDHWHSKRVVTEPVIEEVYKTRMQHQPKRRLREYTSSVHLEPKIADTVR